MAVIGSIDSQIQRYVDSKNGFTFSYPHDWILVPSVRRMPNGWSSFANKEVRIELARGDVYSPNRIYIVKLKVTADERLDLPEIQEGFPVLYSKIAGNEFRNEFNRNIIVHQKKAWESVFQRHHNPNAMLQFRWIFIVGKRLMFVLVTQTSRDQWADVKETGFEMVVNSFKIQTEKWWQFWKQWGTSARNGNIGVELFNLTRDIHYRMPRFLYICERCLHVWDDITPIRSKGAEAQVPECPKCGLPIFAS